MARDIYARLLRWKSSPARKPLILKGARQVGKTHILRHFGESEYANMVYFNFERDPALADFFKGRVEGQKVIEKLGIYSERKITPEETLIIFDEIQAAPNALKSLKYLNEEANEYHIAAAGSLLGVKLGQASPFPVGKVNFLSLYPLTFLEYLEGTGAKRLRAYLESLTECEPIEQAFHERLIDELRLYFFIGGMPETIVTYKEKRDLKEVRRVQNEILTGYESDFSKYAPPSDAQKIASLWESVPVQLARENKKFKYSEVSKNARSRDYAHGLKWLSDAGLIHLSHKVTTAKIPLSAYRDEDSFKIYFLDTGLLGAKLKLTQRTIVKSAELFEQYAGAFTENYVAQELVASGFSDLHYWASTNQAEVDFITAYGDEIFPLEVKAGTNSKAKSLRVYAEKFKPSVVSMATLRNLKKDNDHCNFPLYAVSRFPELISPSVDYEQLEFATE